MNKNQSSDQMDNKELKLIHQFLIDHNFKSTADALMIEAGIKGLQNFNTNYKIQNVTFEANYEALMLSYKIGDWKTFFKLWNLLVPEGAKETTAYKILMLNLHTYFATLHTYKTHSSESTISVKQNFKFKEHIVTEIEDVSENTTHLHTFLHTTGKELKDDVEVQPFFALPFIEDPYAESFVSKMLENSWVDKLKKDIQLFLSKYQQFSSDQEFVLQELKEGLVTEKIVRNNNVPIIPNDRNIPIFFEDGETGEQSSLYNDTNYNQKTKSVQTMLVNSLVKETSSSCFSKNEKKIVHYVQELAAAQSHLSIVHTNYEKLKLRFHKLHADYHKLMSISRVLTTALENSAKGHIIDFQTMLETCIQIFPDLFNHNIRDSSHCSSEQLLDKSHSDVKITDHAMSYSMSVPPKLLDFKKIKLHLVKGSIKVKLLLLQALRKKITSSQAGERDETVHEYISKDLLGLHGQIASYKGKSILPYLLTPDHFIIPHALQQSITRLLNTLASFRCGRDYLSFDSTVVDMVFKCLSNTCDNNIDTVTCNMMIATLQKLSLRRHQRLYMLENGLVEWLIQHLHDKCHLMDSYQLEYATALLMNLSLHAVAQKRASTMASLLILTLINLLSMDHASVLPYVSGALKNFMANHKINEEAKKMKMSSMLEKSSKYKSGQIRKHLDYILKIHKGEVSIKPEDEEIADNDNEEFDILENELEENDPVKSNYGELCGEALLASCYTILPKAFQKPETNAEISSFTQFKIDKVNPNLETNQQVRSLCSELETILHETNFSRHESVVTQRSLENRILYPKLGSHATKIISSPSAVFDERNSKMTVTSSVLLAVESETESTVIEKLSSIASL